MYFKPCSEKMCAVVDHAFTTTKSGAPVLLVPVISPEAPEMGCLQVCRHEGKAYLVRFPAFEVQELTGIDRRILDALAQRVKEIRVVECHPAFFREDGEGELAVAGRLNQVFVHDYSALVVEHARRRARRRWWQFWHKTWVNP